MVPGEQADVTVVPSISECGHVCQGPWERQKLRDCLQRCGQCGGEPLELTQFTGLEQLRYTDHPEVRRGLWREQLS